MEIFLSRNHNENSTQFKLLLYELWPEITFLFYFSPGHNYESILISLLYKNLRERDSTDNNEETFKNSYMQKLVVTQHKHLLI